MLDKVGAPKKKYGSFMDFWKKMGEAIGIDPPSRNRFDALNQLRNDLKHQALLPNMTELRDLAVIVPSFFGEICGREVKLDSGEKGGC